MQRSDCLVEAVNLASLQLQASELAVLAQVCQRLRDHVREITSGRHLDVSRGLEQFPVRVNDL